MVIIYSPFTIVYKVVVIHSPFTSLTFYKLCFANMCIEHCWLFTHLSHSLFLNVGTHLSPSLKLASSALQTSRSLKHVKCSGHSTVPLALL